MLPGEGGVQAINLYKHIAVLLFMEDALRCPGAVGAIIRPVASQPRSGSSSNKLMQVVIGVAVAIVESSVIIEVIMPGKVGSPSFSLDAVPENVSIAGIIIEAVPVANLESWRMAEDENVWLRV